MRSSTLKRSFKPILPALILLLALMAFPPRSAAATHAVGRWTSRRRMSWGDSCPCAQARPMAAGPPQQRELGRRRARTRAAPQQSASSGAQVGFEGVGNRDQGN